MTLKYLKNGTGYDWAGHSNRMLWFELEIIVCHLSPSLSLGLTLPTGSKNVWLKIEIKCDFV